MGKPKRHLVQSVYDPGRAACGLHDPPLWTIAAAHVTCGGCARSLLMADREMEDQQRRKRKQ